MLINKKVLSFLFLLSGCLSSFASERPLNETGVFAKALGLLGTSRLAHEYSRRVLVARSPEFKAANGLSDNLASSKYQELGKEAQDAVGILLERQLPIKTIDSKSPVAGFISALAEPDGIYVNEARVDSLAYGRKRTTVFHEAVHTKYNDMATKQLVGASAGVLSAMAVHKTIKAFKAPGRFKLLHATSVGIVGFSASAAAGFKYSFFIERRADIEGHYASACTNCVQDSAARMRELQQEKNPLLGNGYLSDSELDSIARDLKNQQCSYHKDQVLK